MFLSYGYRSKVLTASSSGSNSLLEWLMELRETRYLPDDQCIKRTELRTRQLEAMKRARCVAEAQSSSALRVKKAFTHLHSDLPLYFLTDDVLPSGSFVNSSESPGGHQNDPSSNTHCLTPARPHVMGPKTMTDQNFTDPLQLPTDL